jgi:uncharacterized protein YdbL (DUF1318 family)
MDGVNAQQLSVYRGLVGIQARAGFLVQIHEAPDFQTAVSQISRRRAEIRRQRRAAEQAGLRSTEARRNRAVSLYFG